MVNYKEVFTRHGYSLFEPDSIESAIIEAIKAGDMRYLYGIPVLLEKEDVDLQALERMATEAGVWERLRELIFISSKIIKDKKKAVQLGKLSGRLKEASYDLQEFRQAYLDYEATLKQDRFLPPLRYHLSFLFAKRQIEILYKVKEGKRLSKTEKEYFSRTIKKKLIAIRETCGFARELLAKG